jgi:hypothetical protein
MLFGGRICKLKRTRQETKVASHTLSKEEKKKAKCLGSKVVAVPKILLKSLAESRPRGK